MALVPAVSDLLDGSLIEGGRWPLSFLAALCDLRPRFLPKGQVGRGYRAIARNGRVLFASPLPLPAWIGRLGRLRLQTWHKAILSGESPRPYGVLVCLQPVDVAVGPAAYQCRLQSAPVEPFALKLDVGGGMFFTVEQA